MKLVTWNVNGIRACAKKGLLEYMDREDPDVLCIQETKAHPEQLDEQLLNPQADRPIGPRLLSAVTVGPSLIQRENPMPFSMEFGCASLILRVVSW